MLASILTGIIEVAVPPLILIGVALILFSSFEDWQEEHYKEEDV